MENRFKFRVWCRALKQFQYFQISLEGSSLPNSNWYIEKEPIQQCTALKDVKGNLVFEGDILSYINGMVNGEGLKGLKVVEWEGNAWNISGWTYFDYCHSFEVIGNIYETPELLEKK